MIASVTSQLFEPKTRCVLPPVSCERSASGFLGHDRGNNVAIGENSNDCRVDILSGRLFNDEKT
jgi:hypothetical protein